MNDRQRVFVDEYLKCWNSAEAARRAGYNGKSNVQGPRLLADDSIKAVIQERLNEIKMSADEVLLRLANMGRANISHFAKIETSDDLENLAEKGELVKKYKRRVYRPKDGDPYEEIELELHDSQTALIQIGKAHGLFTDKTTFDGELVFRIVRDERVQDSPAETPPETE